MQIYKIALIATIALMLSGCSSSKNEAGTKRGTAASTLVKLDGKPITIAGITFRPPSIWKDFGASGMRLADYAYGPIEGESDSATMVVFYFGSGSGGGVGSNIERWIGQMTMPDGSDPHQSVIKLDMTVDSLPAHLIELAGTYASQAGSSMMGRETVSKPNYRMAAVVLETPQGNLFFKLTGPDKTASAMVGAFKTMLSDIKRVSQSDLSQ